MSHDYRDIQIDFTDGTSEVVRSVNRVRVEDNMLTLHDEGSYGTSDHRGSFPLANVKKWRRLSR